MAKYAYKVGDIVRVRFVPESERTVVIGETFGGTFRLEGNELRYMGKTGRIINMSKHCGVNYYKILLDREVDYWVESWLEPSDKKRKSKGKRINYEF